VKPLVLCLCAAALAAGQVPRVGDIEIYGLNKIPAERIRRALNVKSGDELPPSKGDLEERLEEIPGVVQARVEAVCCEEGRAVLFVGIEEKGARHFAFRSEPAAQVALPDEIVETYQHFLETLQEAAQRGSMAEDLTEGHPLGADIAVRAYQKQFATFARDRLKVLRDVLRTGSDPEQRAIAAAVINYAPDKAAVLGDLQYAMQDPDEAVRANAMRAVNAIAVLADKKPELGLRIPSTWFVEMLNSLALSDRTRAASALVNLTDKDAKATLEQIRARALPSVVEMARWRTLRFALPAYILIGRMVGMTEKQIEDSWTKGERETVIRKVLQK
jgi:hypothetical protein